MVRAGAVDVFQYLDYRAYLRDFYADKKARGRLSFRSFSKRAGLKSTNYLKLVMDGERNLSDEMSERFARACGLEGDAAEYFTCLVAFNQASSSTERNERYARLTGFRRYRDAHRLELAQAEYHSTWYLPAIRELVARKDFCDDAAWVARALVPAITPARARRALDTLLELGLLKRGAKGRLEQSEPLVTTGPEARSVHVVAYHRAMMQMASESIDRVPAADRDVSSLTLCLGDDGLRRLKVRIQRFRRELLELSALEDDPQQVVQVNFQMFPLSKARGEESG